MRRSHITSPCPGFDENGKHFDCGKPAGTAWSPIWCEECDERRLARLDEQMKSLTQIIFSGGDAA